MLEALIGAGTVAVIAGIGAAYRIGMATGRKHGSNGNGAGKFDASQYTTREVCLLRHTNIDEALKEIKDHVSSLPEIKAWLNLQQKREEK